MTYSLEITDNLTKIFRKLAKRDKLTFDEIHKKVAEIL